MLGGKKTKLFWCGLFVTALGIISLLGTILGVLSIYRSYLAYTSMYSHGLPASAIDPNIYLWGNLSRSIIYAVIYSVLVGVGVYVAKMGLKTPEQQTAVADKTEPALVR